MTRRVSDLPSCPLCGGRRLPLSLCDACGVASIRRDLATLDDSLACPDCGAVNASQVICDSCHARQPLAEVPGPGTRTAKCPACATFLGPEDAQCPTCGRRVASPKVFASAPKERRVRRIKGDYDEEQLAEIRRIRGVDEVIAKALLKRGYNAPWKLQRAAEAELARIPEIGPEAARRIQAAVRSQLNLGAWKGRDAVLDEQCECPLCRCPTSSFATACLDCGAVFDDEMMDEAVRRELNEQGPRGLLAFYDLHLEDEPEDAALWYARGLLLESMGQVGDALTSFERAASLDPSARKVSIARARLLSRSSEVPDAADRLRSMLRDIVDEVALDQEMSAFQDSISREGKACPYCDEPLPPKAEVCPACSMVLGESQPKAAPSSAPKAERELLDAFVKSLEEDEAPRVEPEPTTPAGMESLVDAFEESLSEEEVEQIRAATLSWLMEELEESMVAEPEEAKARRATPPKAEAARVRPSARPGPPTPRPSARGLLSRSTLRDGHVNGVGSTNGRARVNGLTNGKVNGFVNGRGRVNGFINGKGYVNGASVTVVRLPTPPRRTYHVLLAFGLAMLVVASALILWPATSPPAEPIAIDGLLEDWASVPALDVATASPDPGTDIVRYGALLHGDVLYLHAATRGPALADPSGYDGLFFLLDVDGDPVTGYSFEGLGADYVVEALGNASTVSARLLGFPRDSELNWSRGSIVSGVRSAAGPAGLEVRVSADDMPSLDPTLLRVGVYADTFDGASSRSLAPFTLAGGHILLQTRRLTTVAGVGSTEILEIEIRAVGLVSPSDVWTVADFLVNATPGLTYELSAESVSLTRDRPSDTVRVSVQVPGFFPGDVVSLELLGASASRPVTVVGEAARAYVDLPPTALRVDGLFSDWTFLRVADTDALPVNNSNVDILRYGSATDGRLTYFHVQVGGILFGGSVPRRVLLSTSGGGGGTPAPGLPQRRTGEDLLRVYIDANVSQAQGADVGGILADYLVEVRGQAGRVTSRLTYEWSGSWSRLPGPTISLEKDATAFEGSIDLPGVGNGSRVVYEATDWSGIRDLTVPADVAYVDPSSAPSSFLVTINVPEFEFIAAPILGTLLLGFALRRRRGLRPSRPRAPRQGS